MDVSTRRNGNGKSAIGDQSHRLEDISACVAYIGQELRMPLADAIFRLDTLQNDPLDQKHSAELEAIRSKIEEANQVLTDLFDYSISKHALKREATDFEMLWRIALELETPRLRAKEQNVSEQMPALPCLIELDRTKMVRVLRALLENASNFTPVGGHIRVEARVFGSELHFSICDNGIGIRPEELPHIFEFLYRGADAGALSSSHRHGMGLAIASRIVELHGGTLTVASSGCNRGSEFSIRIPIAATSASTSTEVHIDKNNS